MRERMLAGDLYIADDELAAAHDAAVSIVERYNAASIPVAERRALLEELLGNVGPGTEIRPPFQVDYGFNISIGVKFYANFDCVILDGGEVTIGDHVLFGPRVGIYTSNHVIDADERAAGACYARPVTIGNRVWIGGGVNINQGVTIGDNSIIGSGIRFSTVIRAA